MDAMDAMDDHEKMTPERAERITKLGARLSQLMWDSQSSGGLSLLDVFAAAGVGMRGVAEVACAHLARRKGLAAADARRAVLGVAMLQVNQVFTMPPELFKTIDDGKGDDGASFEAMPVRKH
jgi:hypothetical protein